MDVLIVEPVEAEVMTWLQARHSVRVAPELAIDVREFRHALYTARTVILPPQTSLDAAALEFCPVLRAVGRVSAGAENIDLQACARRGIEVVRSLEATARAEAEFMIGSLLALLRRVPVEGADGLLVGRELGAATVGLVGMTPCAQPLAKLLTAFGARVVGYDPSLHASDPLFNQWQITPASLSDLFQTCDAVCVTLGYFNRYEGLLGERYLTACRPNQVLVSIAHSALFDEAALADALDSGRMAAAWFDSLEPGVLDAGRPLHGVNGLQVTQRLASTTRESRLRSAWSVAQRIDELLTEAPRPAPSPRSWFDATDPPSALRKPPLGRAVEGIREVGLEGGRFPRRSVGERGPASARRPFSLEAEENLLAIDTLLNTGWPELDDTADDSEPGALPEIKRTDSSRPH